MIFTKEQPNVTQVTKDPVTIGLLYNLNAQSKVELNFYAGVYEYPSNLEVSSAAQSGIKQLMAAHAKNYMEKTADYSLDVFDYHQAIASLSAS